MSPLWSNQDKEKGVSIVQKEHMGEVDSVEKRWIISCLQGILCETDLLHFRAS